MVCFLTPYDLHPPFCRELSGFFANARSANAEHQFHGFWLRSPDADNGGDFQDFWLRSPNPRSPKADNGVSGFLAVISQHVTLPALQKNL